MGPFNKSKLKDGIIKFLSTSKNTQNTEKTDLDTVEDMKQDAEELAEAEGEDIELEEVEVEEEEVDSLKNIDFTELVFNMYCGRQKLYSAVSYPTFIKLLSSIANKTTPWFQRAYSETQDMKKLMGTTSILDLMLQQRRRPVHSKIKRLYDRHRY